MKHILAIFLTVLLMVSFSTAATAKRATGQFNQMDEDNNGVVTWDELKAYHPNVQEKVFEEADTNNDDRLSHQEWYDYDQKPRMGSGGKGNQYSGKGAGFGKMNKGKARREQETRFSQMDSNNDGGLSFGELKRNSDEASKDLFRQADLNNDSLLDHDEWSRSRESFGFGLETGGGKY